MNLLVRILKKVRSESPIGSNQFGRYSDLYGNKQTDSQWQKALQTYQEGRFLEACTSFLRSLRDPQQENVTLQQDHGLVLFSLLQGSKQISGKITSETLVCESKIARIIKKDASLLIRMLSKNYDLKYSRYALDPNGDLTIVFDTTHEDGSPHKLYAAFREVALSADKHDDLLLDEFKNHLAPINTGHIRQIPEWQKDIKYRFLQSEIISILDVEDIGNQSPEDIAHLLYRALALCFKIDFLIRPEGPLMESIERIQRLYFSGSDPSPERKLKMIMGELRQISERPKHSVCAEFYEVPRTFGLTERGDKDDINLFFEREIEKVQWHMARGDEEKVCAVADYAIGYILFNFTLPAPLRDAFQLYFQMIHPSYFAALGFPTPNGKSIHASSVWLNKKLKQLIQVHKPEFPDLKYGDLSVSTNTRGQFALTFLEMIRKLQMQAIGPNDN